MRLSELYHDRVKAKVSTAGEYMLDTTTYTVKWKLWGAWKYMYYSLSKLRGLTHKYIGAETIEHAKREFANWLKHPKYSTFSLRFKTHKAKAGKSKGGGMSRKNPEPCIVSIVFRGSRNALVPMVVWRVVEISRRFVADLWLLDCLFRTIMGEHVDKIHRVQLNMGMIWLPHFHSRLVRVVSPALIDCAPDGCSFLSTLHNKHSKARINLNLKARIKKAPLRPMFNSNGHLMTRAKKPDFPDIEHFNHFIETGE